MADGDHRDPWTLRPLSRGPLPTPPTEARKYTCDECGYTTDHPGKYCVRRGFCMGEMREND